MVMRLFILFILWCILLVYCWPIAILALVLFPILWLLSLPFRLFAIILEALFATLRALLLFPARLLNLPFQHHRVGTRA
jgi:hypothetical protein